jgi:hypothetical protein
VYIRNTRLSRRGGIFVVNLIEREIRGRNISRLCHFTPSNKAVHILGSDTGVLAVDFINSDIYDANDEGRYDGKTDYVNCSIQYPNYWYFRTIKDKNPIFKDWVILFIRPELLLSDTTRFCFTNAAYRRGTYIKEGFEAFKAMFAEQVYGNRTLRRSPQMLPCCPTDDQAEVLIYRSICREDIMAIAVPDEEQAKRENKRWITLGDVPSFDIIIAPDLFNGSFSDKVRRGRVPLEYKYNGDD